VVISAAKVLVQTALFPGPASRPAASVGVVSDAVPAKLEAVFAIESLVVIAPTALLPASELAAADSVSKLRLLVLVKDPPSAFELPTA
jgi:hypothetical protein